MRTKATLVVILILGASFSIVTSGGLAAAWGMNGGPQGATVQDALDEVAANSSAENPDGLEGEPTTGDSDLVSIIVDGSQALASAIGNVVLFPTTLMGLGVPQYAAAAIGQLAIVIAGIGLIQFATGRVFR